MRFRASFVAALLCFPACFEEDPDDKAPAASGTETGGDATGGSTTATPNPSSGGPSDDTTAAAETTVGAESTADATAADTSTGEQADWWDNAWSTRYLLAFNNGGPDVDLVDVPVLVVLTPARIDYRVTQVNGEDLRFIASDGTTELDYEIEAWNPAGESTIWVRLPTLNPADGLDSMHVYIGNDDAEAAGNPAGVWSNGFVAVFHLADNLGEDAVTAHASVGPDGTIMGTMSEADSVDGQIGPALSFDGSNDFIAFELDVTDATALTLEAWARPDAALDDGYLLSLAHAINGDTLLHRTATLAANSADAVSYLSTDGGATTETVPTFAADQWSYVSLAWSLRAEAMTAFSDGVPAEPNPVSGVLASLTTQWTIANSGVGLNDTGLNRFYLGQIDEARLSNVARTNGWTETQFLSMTDALVSYGPAESQD